MLLNPASLRTEFRARNIRNDIQEAKRNNDRPKKRYWFKKIMMKLWRPLGKISLLNTIKEKRREKRAARGPYQPAPMHTEYQYVYADVPSSTSELEHDIDNDSNVANERESLASDASSVREEDMLHQDGFDMLNNGKEFKRRADENGD
ncbi:predicted protein [Histoplasma capsulatum G186AR]|uniref:Uncharacterized protein n=1 Tax=Ajellomyces capsulatus (strain G186AR / H82 / ATCC MYA-2454 / RMSCC 2432) TaxID=447093 RepID=C0NS68_AJECG|nr:uncharacterized protein HCBG_05998 [Histoplasma capsulatum G186AR]EEH05734.1 predicted protein [Histoplasma capsulatum G186AR]